ncbi:MAG TPA: hypothetical protein VHT29_09370 [Solirubrobacteraceae bacterium]|jgi:hypothetical protein|nr:hypothetical protein [Solirubrobacteraceae bacterium]
MNRLLHANCFPGPYPPVDALLTDELLVARAAGEPVIAAERGIDHDLAHATSIEMMRAAFAWFRVDGEDPSVVAGISAGDLAGAEAAITILVPAARAVLAMSAALDRGLELKTLVSVVPAGDGRYARLETLAADAAVAAVRARRGETVTVERLVSHDVRNSQLQDKYANVRDPDYLVRTGAQRGLKRTIALGLVNAAARRRRGARGALLVLEYNPSHAFARAYGARSKRRWRLVCWPAQPHDLLAILKAGDEAILPIAPELGDDAPSPPGERMRSRLGELPASDLTVAGVDLWPLVREPLLTLLERYGRYAQALAAPIERELRSRGVSAVLVPFDTPAHARLIVRVAQKLQIPSFVINDGFKTDDIQLEGMTADTALAWSAAMSEGYFARRTNGAVVTGNPRIASLPQARAAHRRAQRVLIGGHTFSGVDLNCGRSDAERFLEQTLAGVAAAGLPSGEVLVKLHPADEPSYYRELVHRHPELSVEMRSSGDVTSLFTEFDVYVTTYSTSLIEAAAAGMPIIYYRINAQVMGPPFTGDSFLAGRTASTPSELAALLADRDSLMLSPPAGWIEHYLGPTQAVDRMLAAIDSHIAGNTHAVPAAI